jgi:hypothetical protein
MKKSEKIALFLGMLSGDGCLPIKHSGEGFRDYAIQFYNTDKKKVELFADLTRELFGGEGRIRYSDRKDKQRLWEFCRYSKEIVLKLRELGFPEGVKRDVLRILNIILRGNDNDKLEFCRGVLITDGCIRKDKTIIFHSGSRLFLEDLSKLIEEFIRKKKSIREFIQEEKYKSYQLNLNKKESELLISKLKDKPTWDNGTPVALSSKTR